MISSRWWLEGDKGSGWKWGCTSGGRSPITREASHEPDNVTFVRKNSMPIHPEHHSQDPQEKKGLVRGKQGDGPPYPHGHAYCTVHVALVQPSVLGDPTLLRAEGSSILGDKCNTTINLPSLLMGNPFNSYQVAPRPFTGVTIWH